jgi:L-ascorbate metabolism protein UlaG (beta-lactamase superfamily)
MRLTKFTHSCVRLDKDGSVLVLDPGNFSTAEELREALDGVDHILVTHEHPDHYDADVVNEFLDHHPDVQVHAPGSIADDIKSAVSAPDRVHEVRGEESFDLSPFSVRTFGGQHALIHPLVPIVENIGFMIDETLYHPGDSLIVPDAVHVRNLLVPIHAPWNKLHEVVDFVISVGADHAYPIHDGLLAERGLAMLTNHLKTFGGKYGTTYARLDPYESVDLEETP